MQIRTLIRSSILFMLLALGFMPMLAAADTSDGTVAGTPDGTTVLDGPTLSAPSAVLMDMSTGQILYAKQPHQHNYPASITKIMTAVIALEHGKMNDPITTSKLATLQDGNRVYLEEGETKSLHDLLYGLMLDSGNDAAVAIAEHYGGSVQGFARMMNEKAMELGMYDTHFVTPNGLHDPGHYTSAYDMALLGRYAMQNQTFRKIVATKEFHWHSKGWDTELFNLNRMLWNYPGCTGIKTGFTDQAQQTMVVSARRDGRELIAVLMHVQGLAQIQNDATALLDWGFTHYENIRLGQAGETVTTLQYRGMAPIDVQLENSVTYERPVTDPRPIVPDLELTPPPRPFPAKTVVGRINYTLGGVVVASSPLLAAQAAPAPQDAGRWLAVAGLLAVVMYLAWRYRRNRAFYRLRARPSSRNFSDW